MRRGFMVVDIETVLDEDLYTPPNVPVGQERPFPPIYAHRPIAIGVLWLGQDLTFQRLGIIGEDKDEPGQLEAFATFVGREAPTLVTWNGRSFDLPVIVHRCLRHGVELPWYYTRSDVRYRYSDEGHLDLGDVFTDRGAVRHMTPLDKAAQLIGLPGKMGVDGSQVDPLYRAGKLDVIQHYCLTDVIQTAFIMLRYLLLSGRNERPVCVRAIRDLLGALEEDGRFGELLDKTDRQKLLLGSVQP